MKVEIIFHTSSTPKIIEDAYAVYTKGDLCCVQLKSGIIIKYPLCNIFSIAHEHGEHLGTTKKLPMYLEDIDKA
jgi:hypothetical protein